MAQEDMENLLLNLGKCIIDRETKFMGADVYRIKDENGNAIGSSKKRVIRDSNDKEIGKVKKKALSPTWVIQDSRGKPMGFMKKKRIALTPTYMVESPSGDLITSIKGESGGYHFYAPDGKTLLASLGWEAAERAEAIKEGGMRGFVKKAAEVAKAALKGKRVLHLHSEQLRPLLALSSAIQLMEIEKEEERKREEGGDWDARDRD
jgi:hypothetical protein